MGTKYTLPLSPHAQVVLAASAIESTRIALESFSLIGTGVRTAAQGELMGQVSLFQSLSLLLTIFSLSELTYSFTLRFPLPLQARCFGTAQDRS